MDMTDEEWTSEWMISDGGWTRWMRKLRDLIVLDLGDLRRISGCLMAAFLSACSLQRSRNSHRIASPAVNYSESQVFRLNDLSEKLGKSWEWATVAARLLLIEGSVKSWKLHSTTSEKLWWFLFPPEIVVSSCVFWYVLFRKHWEVVLQLDSPACAWGS